MLNTYINKACSKQALCLKLDKIFDSDKAPYLGMWELCWNNFRNNDGVKESRIILEF